MQFITKVYLLHVLCVSYASHYQITVGCMCVYVTWLIDQLFVTLRITL